MKAHRSRFTAALLLLLFGIGLGYYARSAEAETVLTIGVYFDPYDLERGSTGCEAFDQAVAVFERNHPDIRVEYVEGVTASGYQEWLAERIVRGEIPDVFLLPQNGLDELNRWSVLADLSDVMAQDDEFDTSIFYKAALASGQRGGVQYALPLSCDTRLMMVNRTLLQEHGVPMPRSTWDLDDLFTLCQTMTIDEDGNGFIDCYGLQGYTWSDALAANGQTLFTDDGSKCRLTEPAVKSSMAFFQQYYKLNNGVTQDTNAFWEGTCALVPLSLVDYRSVNTAVHEILGAEFEWDCVPMPTGDYVNGASYVDTVLVGMNRATPRSDLAWELLKILTTDKEVQNLICSDGGVSAVRNWELSYALDASVANTPEDMILQWLDRAIVRGTAAENFTGCEQLMQMLDAEFERMAAHDRDPDIVLGDLQRRVTESLQ